MTREQLIQELKGRCITDAAAESVADFILARHSEAVDYIYIHNLETNVSKRLSRIEDMACPTKPVAEKKVHRPCSDGYCECGKPWEVCNKPSKPIDRISIDRKVAEEWIEARRIKSGLLYAGCSQELEKALKTALEEGK